MADNQWAVQKVTLSLCHIVTKRGLKVTKNHYIYLNIYIYIYIKFLLYQNRKM